MKRTFILFITLFVLSTALFAQEQQVKVTLKNGTTMVGELVSLDPINSIEIKIGGIECKIPMSEVANVENTTETAKETARETTIETPADHNTNKKTLDYNKSGDYLVTDTADYPDSITVSICNRKFTLILVRGGTFNMGYDGSESDSMESEPVHKVEISSFYVLKDVINDYTAYNFLEPTGNKPKGDKFVTRDWNKAKQVVDGIAAYEAAPYRLLTEAEWEYMAIQPISKSIFEETINSKSFSRGKYIGEWCSDFKSGYDPSDQINPQGPKTGRKHVVRAFAPNNMKWSRNTKHFNYFYTEYYNYFGYCARLAISADSIDKLKL